MTLSRMLRAGLALVGFTLLPVLTIRAGYFPIDDALRHAAKAVSGKEWSEVLVLRPEMSLVDSHPGWHAILGTVHGLTGASAPTLVVFSVVSLFLLPNLVAVVRFRRPEVWVIVCLVTMFTAPNLLNRWLLGRPFLVDIAALLVLCSCEGQLFREKWPWTAWAATAGMLGLCAWIHPSWYLFGVVVLAWLLAGRFRSALRLASALGVGCAIAMALSGKPLLFLWQSLLHPWLALGTRAASSTLVSEFRPWESSPWLIVITLGALTIGHRSYGRSESSHPSPALFVVVVGFALGFLSKRFWLDWGGPALMFWMAERGEDWLEASAMPHERNALLVPMLGALTACVLAGPALWASPQGSTGSTYRMLLEPRWAQLLPAPGGIIYSDDMRLFFRLFYDRPLAPWRYLVGFEPGLMPEADLAVYRAAFEARASGSAWDFHAYRPWAERLRPEDRLIVHMVGAAPETVAGVTWVHVHGPLWCGLRPIQSAP